MPSFTRRAPAGTTPSTTSGPSTSSTPSLTSPSNPPPLIPTGIPSLDDLLGSGLPLGSSLAILSPDIHSAWGRLVSRYFIAQGLVSGEECIVLGVDEEQGRELVKGCMWVEERERERERESGKGKGKYGGQEGSESEGETVGDVGQGRGGGRIAWRYDAMGRFQTSIGRSNSLNLMKTIPSDLVPTLEKSGAITYIPVSMDGIPGPSGSSTAPQSAIQRLYTLLDKKGKGKAVRVVVHELGGSDWGPSTSTHIHRFLHSLRSILRTTSASSLITFPPSLISSPPSDISHRPLEGWIKSLAWAVDGCIEMRGFADNPALGPHFAPLHGLITLHSFPTVHTLVPPTLRHSTLLGVSQSATNERGGGGAGENNLGFRVKRKGLVIETAHLGIEGGSSERRTEPPKSVQHVHGNAQVQGVESTLDTATEGIDRPVSADSAVKDTTGTATATTTKPKVKKSVRVQFDDKSLEF